MSVMETASICRDCRFEVDVGLGVEDGNVVGVVVEEEEEEDACE